MSLHLRAATALDAGCVGAILSGFTDETGWMPRIHSRAEDLAHAGDLIGRGWVTVAETGGAVQGFIARDGALIQSLYVAAPMRGCGLGAALLAGAQVDTECLTLWTFAANIGAQRFYARHGFAEIARSDGAGNDEGLPDIELQWRRC